MFIRLPPTHPKYLEVETKFGLQQTHVVLAVHLIQNPVLYAAHTFCDKRVCIHENG